MSRLEVQGISKHFGDLWALDNVSLTLEGGRIYGLLGRNGAGKTTLLNIISSRLFANGGSVTLDGQNAVDRDEAMSQMYLMSEKTFYPQEMKIREIFRLSKLFYPDFDEGYARSLADRFSLSLNKKIGKLSTGYNSIAKLIVALSVNTPFVFFDEPVLGLDANHRELFYTLLVEKYMEKPFCAVISTHLIEEVSRLVEEVIIIDEGRILLRQSAEELLATGYCVSGRTEQVDAYVAGLELIGADSLGPMKLAYVLGAVPIELPEGLELSRLDLQKLFVKLTTKGGKQS